MYTHTRELLPFMLSSRWCLYSSFSQHEARPPPKEEMDVFSRNTHSVVLFPGSASFPAGSDGPQCSLYAQSNSHVR